MHSGKLGSMPGEMVRFIWKDKKEYYGAWSKVKSVAVR